MSEFTGISWRAGWMGLALAAAAVFAPASVSAEPYVYVARAHLVDVERAFVNPTSAPLPGAGVRAFQDPDPEDAGTERFDIRWYANPPGIPPGAVILLEAIQERSPVVRNHVLRTADKSEGHVCSVVEIPSDEVRQGGRVVKWRVRLVWRGKVLSAQTSSNWDG